MTSSRFFLAFTTAFMLAAGGGAAFAQADDANEVGFYADPVLPDPPRTVAHPLASSVATADVGVVSPAADSGPSRKHETPCSALNPCAVSVSGKRG